MVNRERGEMVLATPTSTYTLRLTVEACCELEARTGLDFDVITARVNQGRAAELRWLLWAALQARHADAVSTPEIAGAIMDAVGGVRVIRAILSRFLRLNADDDQPKDEKGKPAPPDDRPGSLWRRLYLDARCAGIPDESFWRLSLRELWLELAAARQQARHDAKQIIRQAWWNTALSRHEKVPSLESILGGGKPQRQTPQEQRAVIEQLSGALGVPITRIPWPTKGPTH